MPIQKTYWGQTLWLHMRDELSPNQSINVGLFVVERGKKQDMHIHYGEEQFSYIFEGTGRHTLGDETRVLEPGSYIYLPPGVAHEIENIGNGPLRGLMCSNPISFLPKISMDFTDFFQNEEPSVACADLRSAVESLQTKLNDTFIVPYTIFDAEWNILLQNNHYPAFCLRICNPLANNKETPCMAAPEANTDTRENSRWFVCPYGLVIYQQPLIHRGMFLGLIRGGHSEIQSCTMGHAIHDSIESVQIGIQNLLHQLARALLAYCDFEYVRNELYRKNILFEHSEIQKQELAQHLRLSEDKATGLLIDRHFLFNTLNSMADMALQKNCECLYTAILSLAGMLHYTAHKTRSFVTLRQELAHIDNYLSLKKLRFNGKLAINKNIPDDLLRCYVPMDFLLPVVENAFVHGFKNHTGEKKLGIRIEQRGNTRISIFISNNGAMLEAADVEKINQNIISGNGHGLSLIFTKLKILYEDDFSMRMLIDSNQGMGVLIEIPLRFEDVSHD